MFSPPLGHPASFDWDQWCSRCPCRAKIRKEARDHPPGRGTAFAPWRLPWLLLGLRALETVHLQRVRITIMHHELILYEVHCSVHADTSVHYLPLLRSIESTACLTMRSYCTCCPRAFFSRPYLLQKVNQVMRVACAEKKTSPHMPCAALLRRDPSCLESALAYLFVCIFDHLNAQFDVM